MAQNNNNEAGIPGVIVTLVSNGSVVATTTTDGTGFYSFTGLTRGIPYSVSFMTPAGLTGTAQTTGNDPTIDSNPNPATGLTAPVTLTAAENNLTIDAGFYQLVPKLNLTRLRLVDKTTAKKGDVLTYSVVLTNTGDASATAVVVQEQLARGLTYYVPGSASAPAVVVADCVQTRCPDTANRPCGRDLHLPDFARNYIYYPAHGHATGRTAYGFANRAVTGRC